MMMMMMMMMLLLMMMMMTSGVHIRWTGLRFMRMLGCPVFGVDFGALD